MADAWTNLLEHSSLSSGDAWDHLLAQEGGGGHTTDRYIGEGPILFKVAPEGHRFVREHKETKFSTVDRNKG